jgi:hypothetical protein
VPTLEKRRLEMTTTHRLARAIACAVSAIGLTCSPPAGASDVESFATGGYAAGLRSREMLNIIDTDGDGTISRDEWNAYQNKVFRALDTHHRGKLNVAIFASRTELRLGSSLATGGYASGLRSAELAHKIDADGDGWISESEWMGYQGKIFDLLNTSSTHRNEVGDEELFATGGANRP